MAEIEIIITEDGRIEGEVEGVQGPDCEGMLDFLRGLGFIDDEGKTRDYYRKPRRRGRRSQEDRRHTRR